MQRPIRGNPPCVRCVDEMIAPWTMRRLVRTDPAREFAQARNLLFSEKEVAIERREGTGHVLVHCVDGGIERFHYHPKERNTRPPLLMIHGIWHTTSCWRYWQAWLTDHGWESVAFTLPGHGRSPEQRRVATCSMAYYLRFLVIEVEQLDVSPIPVGHDMGGALVQWYGGVKGSRSVQTEEARAAVAGG